MIWISFTIMSACIEINLSMRTEYYTNILYKLCETHAQFVEL